MVESGAGAGEGFPLFSCHGLSLFDACAQQAQSDGTSADFTQEWNEFFAESCANFILPAVFSRCGKIYLLARVINVEHVLLRRLCKVGLRLRRALWRRQIFE